MHKHNTLITREELIRRLCIKMAASNRNPPILRGKAAPRDNRERDAFRAAFASWFVEECIEKNGLVVMNTYPPATLGHGMRIVRGATPPQLLAR